MHHHRSITIVCYRYTELRPAMPLFSSLDIFGNVNYITQNSGKS
jgi:hypothetical protein